MLEVRPTSKLRTLLEWYLERDRIDMTPSYQRRSDLWPDRNQKLLINSILNRYDIPKIYLADFTYISTDLNEHRKPYAVIDGKQRLNIFFAFFEDRLRLDNRPVYFEGQELKLGGMRYSDLRATYPALANVFEDFVPTVMSVISNEFEEVQELFIRLNQNVPISGPEKRNAMPGPLPPLIKELSVHVFFRKHATFPNSRGQDLNAAAKMLLLEDKGGFTNTKKQDLDRFVRVNADRDAKDFLGIRLRATETLNDMMNVFQEGSPLLKGQAQLPVYYWLIKNHADQYAEVMERYLKVFEEQRGVARAQANARARGEEVKIGDPALLEYNTWLRTPDDRTKQEQMYSLIEERFQRFVRQVWVQAELT